MIAVGSELTCCVCDSTMQQWREPWCFRCPVCRTWASDLPIGINTETHEALDEDQRELGLAALREHNNAVVLQSLAALGLSPGADVLDVGSAHGWFLTAAAARGYQAQGIEPDAAVAQRAETSQPVRVGLFPDVLESTERFDAICFNDVLEHFSDPQAAVGASLAHLRPGGLLSVNIPNSAGLFYRGATVADRLGVRSAFERLWQVGLPSPHRWFFDRARLARLGERAGVELVSARSLDSVRRNGLWQRAHADRSPSAVSVAGVAAVWLAAPLLNASFASDIMHLVFRRPADPV